MFRIESKKNKEYKEKYEKMVSYYLLLNVWLEMRQKGKTVAPYMREKGYKRIAIYGMQELGHRLIDELKGTEISVEYVIDKKSCIGDFEIITPDVPFPKVDAIIVTAEYYFSEIKKELEEKCEYPIISLRTLLGNAFHRMF